MGRERLECAASVTCKNVSPTSHAGTNGATMPAFRNSTRSSELRRSSGTAGRPSSTEQRQTCGCADFVQQLCDDSAAIVQQQLQASVFGQIPVAAQPPTVGATLTRSVATISGRTKSFLLCRNIWNPVDVTSKASHPNSGTSSSVLPTVQRNVGWPQDQTVRRPRYLTESDMRTGAPDI